MVAENAYAHLLGLAHMTAAGRCQQGPAQHRGCTKQRRQQDQGRGKARWKQAQVQQGEGKGKGKVSYKCIIFTFESLIMRNNVRSIAICTTS